MAQISDEEQPHRSIVSRIVRFPIKVVVLLFVLLFRPFVRHPKISAAVIVVLGVAAYSGYTFYLAPAPGSTTPATPAPSTAASTGVATGATSDNLAPRVTTQSPLPSPTAPIAYIRAMSQYDAHTMWVQLSPNSQATQGSEQALQQRLDNMKPRPGTVKEITYVGGSKMRDGSGVYMYVLTVQNGNHVDQSAMTVYLDSNGKITNLV